MFLLWNYYWIILFSIFIFLFSLWQLWRWQDPLCKTSLRSVFRQSHCPSKPFFMDIRRNDRSSSEKSNLYIIPKGLFINFHFSKFLLGRCCRCEWLMTCFCLSRKYVTGGGGHYYVWMEPRRGIWILRDVVKGLLFWTLQQKNLSAFLLFGREHLNQYGSWFSKLFLSRLCQFRLKREDW